MKNTLWKEKFKEVFGLRIDQASKEEIAQRITTSATVTGTNMYILILAILIASIGLNMNSTAVIIGAMLISPLMSLILSIAYAISMGQSQWLKKSLLRFLFQIGVSILTSTIYFMLTPIDSFSGELAARTNPTIWDVLIAICGGLAAIIANTRKSMVSNIIPGAAIATALMPPLCTVGYCLATAKWWHALGAFYLFFINTIFICLSSIIGFQIMKIVKKNEWLSNYQKCIFLSIIILLAVVPSCFLAWQSVQEINLQKQYNQFIRNELNFDNTQVVKSEIDTTPKIIRVALIGSVLDDSTLDKIQKALPQYNLGEYQLEVTQTQLEQGITQEQLAVILSSQQQNNPSDDLEKQQKNLQTVLDVQSKAKELQINTAKEILLLYPSVKSVGFSQMQNMDDTFFALVLQVDCLLDQDTIITMKSWLEHKFNTKTEVLQIVESLQLDSNSTPLSDENKSDPNTTAESALS